MMILRRSFPYIMEELFSRGECVVMAYFLQERKRGYTECYMYRDIISVFVKDMLFLLFDIVNLKGN